MNPSSLATVKVLVPLPVPSPRGAEWAATVSDGLLRLSRSVWAELERSGARRAQHHLEMLGLRHPQLAERTEALGAAMRRDAVVREAGQARR